MAEADQNDALLARIMAAASRVLWRTGRDLRVPFRVIS